MASRYSSYTTTTNASSFDSRSSTKSDPSSSTERLHHPFRDTSRAIIKSEKNQTISTATKNNSNVSSMMRKLVQTKTSSSSSNAKIKDKGAKLFIPADFIAEDLKKNGAKKIGGLSAIQKKLFKGLKPKKESEGSSGRKALTEVKSANANTRTLAMVLRSERELLCMNKEQEEQIAELKLLLEEKNREVEKLKDLCLKQREEIKALKSSILFPDVMNSQLQGLFEKQGSELKQAKQLIPSLQRQVSSLTGQLQCLAEDLAEVKAEKYSGKACYGTNIRSPTSPAYYQEEADNSLEFSSDDNTVPGSPDDMFLKDLNPCLTPYNAKEKSKDFDESPEDEWLSRYETKQGNEIDFISCPRELSKSSDCCQCSKPTNSSVRVARGSDECRRTYRKQMHHKLF